MLQYIIPASGLLFTLQNIIWINLGVFIGAVFAAIPGLSVILCVILFLPLTYQLTAIPGMMFLLGIYCAGGYGAASRYSDQYARHAACRGHHAGRPSPVQPGTYKGGAEDCSVRLHLRRRVLRADAAVLGPQVAKIAAQLGTAEYFMVCLFGLTIIAGVSGKSMIRGLISACLGLLISCIGADPMTSYDRFTFGIPRLYLGLDLAICLIGLFALVEILAKAEKVRGLHLDTEKMKDNGLITKEERRRMARPILISSIIGVIVGIIPVPAPPKPPGSAITRRKTCPSILRNSATALWKASRPLNRPTTP